PVSDDREAARHGATPPTDGSTTPSTAGSANNCCGAIFIIMQRLHEDDLAGYVLGQSRGRWCAFRQSPKPTRRIRSRRSGRRDPSPAAPARHCIRRASRSTRLIASAGRSANTTSPANISETPGVVGRGLAKAEWLERYGENDRPASFERITSQM